MLQAAFRLESQSASNEVFLRMNATGILFPQTSKVDAHATSTVAGVPATRVLGVPISTINMGVAVRTILDWVEHRNAQYVCVRDVHGIMRAQEDPALMAIHHGAGLITPDGMPLAWTLKARGYRDAGRVCGADLVAALCLASVPLGTRHYLYGGKPGVAERMATTLTEMFPGLQIIGSSTPPFRALTPDEDEAMVAKIASMHPDVVWIGLSTPKQEYWMRDHVARIPGATLIGIGAAFDFYAGDVKRAPRWMHSSGLEWLHRLISEPRRLWRRYLVLAPRFVVLMARGEVQPGRRDKP